MFCTIGVAVIIGVGVYVAFFATTKAEKIERLQSDVKDLQPRVTVLENR